MQQDVDSSRMKTFIREYLDKIPETTMGNLPKILREPNVGFYTYVTNDYFVLAFVDKAELKRIEDYASKGYHPFPGLIKPKNVSMPVAFRVEGSRNLIVNRCSVDNLFAFSLGEDSTVVVSDLRQSIKTKELGSCKYTLELAYIISFGDEIKISNLYDHLRQLMDYSLTKWGVTHGP